MNVAIGIGARVKLARLMLATDARSAQGDLAQFLESVITGGVDVVLISGSGLDPETELAALRTAREVATRHRRLVVASDSAALASASGADAVHLRGRPASGEPADVRSSLGPHTRLGTTAEDRRMLRQLLGDTGVDFVLVDATADLDLVAEAAEAAPVALLESKPWYAAGEFDLDRLELAIEVGVRRIAVSRTLTEADDPHDLARRLSQRLGEVWADDPELTRLTFAALAEQTER